MTGAYDVAVIGAGPAGVMAAGCCAQLGARVVLIDRGSFPRDKVCGGCINEQAQAILKQAGLIEAIHGVPRHALHAVMLQAGGRAAEMTLGGSVAVARCLLDHALVRAVVKRGVVFQPQTLAAVHAHGRLLLRLKGGQQTTMTAGCVVVADGLGGRSLDTHHGFKVHTARGARIGVGATLACDGSLPAGKIVMACGSGGYVGMVRLGDGRMNIAAALSPKAIRRRSGCSDAPVYTTVKQVLEQAGAAPPGGLEQARWTGTATLTRQRKPLYGPRVLVAGDAAGYVEPFTGEGIAWALASGAAVAPLAVRASRQWDDSIGRDWQAVYHQQIRRRQRGCRMIAALLRYPSLTAATVRMLHASPRALGGVIGCLAALGVALPSVQADGRLLTDSTVLRIRGKP